MIRQSLIRSSRTALRAKPVQPSWSSSLQRPQQQISPSNLPFLSRAQLPAWQSSSRWYSSEAATEGKKEEMQGNGVKEGEQKQDQEDPVKKELEAKNKEIVDLKDKYLRSVADFRNLQERTRREVQAAKDFALQRFAKDLVDSVDNLDRALSTVSEDKLAENADLNSLHEGVRMTETVLMQTLKKHGLERFDPSEKGEKFDPNIHDATFQAPQPDKEEGTVFHTQQKGFMLNGRVIRAAKVGVVKNS
ncbi:mitochondrial co-chaperone-like protein GrpE [Lineolata rhizophorae]|uniref:GrpE protein homolog n=1 Tax=Lineolata rhizophorae TaxID=578093 RepID=A0A6A6P9X2_9PEZI|nr:mitochondrial co-chaperone-like protein GrpE [Lineolata rhizophorae]